MINDPHQLYESILRSVSHLTLNNIIGTDRENNPNA